MPKKGYNKEMLQLRSDRKEIHQDRMKKLHLPCLVHGHRWRGNVLSEKFKEHYYPFECTECKIVVHVALGEGPPISCQAQDGDIVDGEFHTKYLKVVKGNG